MSDPTFSFDEAYYQKFYRDRRTRVADRKSCALLANFVFSYLDYLRLPVERVLDVGCGTGLWRREVRQRYPEAVYVGVERSEYACRKYGWELGSVVDYRPTEDFDLVICQGVFQYLDDAEAEAALDNLPRLAPNALYLEILTAEDWERNCNREVTDGEVHLRSVAWYRKRLRRHFRNCGGGLFLGKGSPAVLYELERL
ncbi:MAG TPA: class I SAM-dependent methyltransferase [Thermoanaerobaculia bacterium]|nr:class I SAM-dependent methyltransferase [Thermoanaerobaculia bacterium]